MTSDEKYMQRCLYLAKLGFGNTYPNPMVGSIIVHNNKIIGEGYHHKAGEAHAEVNAIQSVKNKDLLKEATLYVSLEPCAHYGKTPPCSLLIIESKIPRVVIACVDSFSKVAGKGIKMMEEAGIQVTINVLKEEGRELNKRFFTFHEKKRPYIILKWAQTLDGLIDKNRSKEDFGQPTWITNDQAKRIVHQWRTQEACILVGTKTAIKDNPSLTAREWSGKDPVRLLIDKDERVPKSAHLLDNTVSTLVFTSSPAREEKNTKYLHLNVNEDIVPQILDHLYDQELQSVIIEGGRQVLQSFIDLNLWDEARVWIGEKFFKKGIFAPVLDSKCTTKQRFGNSQLYVYQNNL